MAEIIRMPFEELKLRCEKCDSDSLHLLIRGQKIIIECAKCEHRVEREIINA
jgi:hypothetical protein